MKNRALRLLIGILITLTLPLTIIPSGIHWIITGNSFLSNGMDWVLGYYKYK